MGSTFFSSYKVDDRSYIAFVKREIHNLVHNAGFSTLRLGEIDIIISELTSNLIKYGGSGELLYRIASEKEAVFFEIFCIDNGPGISNISKMMKDGNSSSNSLGQGLGAINRLSDFFQIYSMGSWGTVLYSRVYQDPRKIITRLHDVDFGTAQICAPGEQVCGDGYYVKETVHGKQIFVGDGLGHGAKANEAVQEAITAFKSCTENEPVEILRFMHQSVKKTRGLVATIACIDNRNKEWKICGIGNISTRLYSGMVCKNYTSYNGIVGHNIPRTLNSSVIPLEKHQTIIMHSDGIRTRWNINELPSLLKYDPYVIATAIYKDNARGNDDMTVLVGKINIS